MRILSIGKTIQHDTLNITSIEASALQAHPEIEAYHISLSLVGMALSDV